MEPVALSARRGVPAAVRRSAVLMWHSSVPAPARAVIDHPSVCRRVVHLIMVSPPTGQAAAAADAVAETPVAAAAAA